jgi:hypothetical protein
LRTSIPALFPSATYFNSKKMKRNFTKINHSLSFTGMKSYGFFVAANVRRNHRKFFANRYG